MYLLFPSFNFFYFFGGENNLTEEKKISHQRQETPTFELNYKFKSESYFSGVEPGSSRSLCLPGCLYSYVRWWTPPKPSRMRRRRQTGAKCCGWEDEGTAFLGALSVYGPSIKHRHKGKEDSFFFFFLHHMLLFRTGARLNGIWGPETLLVQAEQVCCRGFQSHTHQHTHTHTHIYTAVYTLQSHNATTLNVAAAQIGHLELGRCILKLLSNFQSVKWKFTTTAAWDNISERNIRWLSVMLLSAAEVSTMGQPINVAPDVGNGGQLFVPGKLLSL